MILHPEFINDHIKHSEPNYFIQGSRVLFTEAATKKILLKKNINFSFFSSGLLNRKNSIYSNSLSKIFIRKKNYLSGIKSCNMSLYKSDCIKVNGFNNEIEGWGREDSEFAVRLLNRGINRKNIFFSGIQFHLWHPINSRLSLRKNDLILENTIKKKLEFCMNGINIVKSNEN